MSTIKDDDKFLVQRGENSYRTNASALMSTINAETEPYDYMLIQRGELSFKVSAKDVKDQLGGPAGGGMPAINTAVLSEQAPNTYNRFTAQKFDLDIACLSGTEPIFYDLKAKVYGELNLKFDTSNVTYVDTRKAYIYGESTGSTNTTTTDVSSVLPVAVILDITVAAQLTLSIGLWMNSLQ